jgi:hypothetical protein
MSRGRDGIAVRACVLANNKRCDGRRTYELADWGALVCGSRRPGPGSWSGDETSDSPARATYGRRGTHVSFLSSRGADRSCRAVGSALVVVCLVTAYSKSSGIYY